MSTSSHSATARHRKSTPCRWYTQGHCRFGDKCKFSHDAQVHSISKATCLDQHQREHPTSSHPVMEFPRETCDARSRPKHEEKLCRAWKAGTCTRGSQCWFRHDVDVQKPGLESVRSPKHKQSRIPHPEPVPLSMKETPITSPAPDSLLHHAELVRPQEAEATAAAAREHANTISREEAAKTTNRLVSGSIVTFSAGLDVANLIAGFETCTLRVGNLPLDVKENDIRALLMGQGLNVNDFHFIIKKKSDHKPEAHIVTDLTTGRVLAQDLDGVEFQEETLQVEMSATNSLEGMNAATGQSSEILTISWHAPSARYIAEFDDMATARAKVEELNRFVYGNRRLKVEMNTQPRGRFVPNLPVNAIKISNLPPSVGNEDVSTLTDSKSVKRLPIGGVFATIGNVEEIARLVRNDIDRAVPGKLKKFDEPGACTMEGVVFTRAHFSSWDEAHAAYTRLSDRRYGVWLKLPDPMYFTLVIPVEQYKAQKTQWDSLSSSIKDRKACNLNVRDSGNVVCIRLSGSVKEATGALKVRVENLAKGEKVEGWHRSFGVGGNSFVLRIRSETGAYMRADWKRQSLKVYGAPRAVEHAREMIKGELERLASLDYTTTLSRHSVGFFVREGLEQLKETLGEDNVRFAMSSRKITVSGGEEAQHALNRLIALSHKGNQGPLNVAPGNQTCPICYDDVSSPHQLGCGHAYCVACLRHFISSTLESNQLPLVCLGNEAQCRVPIPIPTIQQFLPPASFNRLLEAAFEAHVAKHPDEFKHCKTPDCVQIYRAASRGTTPQPLRCPSCFATVCNSCHEDAHEGLSCAEHRVQHARAAEERLNETWIASQGGRVKKCPQCSVPIEKLEGCNHMTCRCGAHICWRCMGVFTRETIYQHMHSEHGGIHGDGGGDGAAPPLTPADIGFEVDVEEQRALFRQVAARRAAAQNAYGPRPALDEDDDGEQVGGVRFWWQEEQERAQAPRGQWREARRLREERRRQEVEERERQQQELRLLQEAEERRRAQERQDGGWGCTIM